MDKRMKRSLYILVLLAITYLSLLLYIPVTGFLSELVGVVSPFIFGFAIAFILHPLVDWLVGKKIKRIYAVLLVVVSFIGVFALFFGAFLPLVFAQFMNVIKIAPGIISDMVAYFEDTILGEVSYWDKTGLSTFDWQSLLSSSFSSTTDLVSLLLTKAYSSVMFIVVTPILLVYFLFEYNNIREYVKGFLAKHEFDRLRAFFKDYEKLLSRYVGGLLSVMVVLSIISSIMFHFSGLENALLFGFIIGLTNVIPFIGNIIGGLIAILFALSQSTTLAIIIAVEVIILIVIESNFVTPMIQGKSISINPLVIIFGITIFGFIFGFFGILLAIPLIIMIKLIVKHFFEKL